MKFLLDAQLPKKLSLLLLKEGHDSIHTLDLTNRNRTKDSEINEISIREERIVISKDLDFIESLLISDKPYKLLYISTGNITNRRLLDIFQNNLEHILASLQENRLVELTNEQIIVHS